MAITTPTSTQTTTTMKIVLIKTILRRSDYNYTEKKLNIPKKRRKNLYIYLLSWNQTTKSNWNTTLINSLVYKK